ncbi:hypothetical protein KL907_002762 [Ogataea polymorpha]|uniref:uncharacterized protein n=1 Tax=Ogataea polymorpha TaxID=460523 RepID=UPI0007F4FF3D|nr:uncharacterized protein OGAPODRAFT_17145 [Ogataea polymorpha]KAG7889956.1 hypothetical protein KL936_002630 [Ogataea polymorpha]KAG7905615.1 hypothetical protein KL907_002762 [Ogataea polymorpha]KAG7917036.1 hypothetical protein KL927_002810 [Ogataea polymorpha]KAG7936405.1 hypothetical protein KL934_001872 [Ogataea polymorpha]OBA14269.1 hypothetical protein OGAPODRAFT_17145 [Ogataea polymorpha]
MQFTSLFVLATSLVAASAQNILLTNDDGWAATNIRAFYRDLKASGHNVVMVAPARQYSGNGGRFITPTTSTLTAAAVFEYPPAGSPAWGHEEDDSNVWYFDGSPAACVAFGLDYVVPKYFNNMTVDVVVGGPNEGNNLGERDYVISGTIGATYYATERGYPAIAFSGANSNNSFFKDNLDEDPDHAPNIYSKYAIQVLEALAKGHGDGDRLLPESYALNVNFPAAGSDINASCRELTFRHTRFTGSKSLAYKVEYDHTAENMKQTTLATSAVQNCAAGDCELPDEFTIINNGNCEATISVFAIDLDAGEQLTEQTLSLFESVLEK